MGYFKMFKNWWVVVKPNKKAFFGQLITAWVANALHTFTTIPAANVISCLTIGKFEGLYGAYFWLIVGFLMILARNIIWHINYRLFPIQLRHIYMQAQRSILGKIFTADDKSLKLNTKEKIINTISSNLNNCADFADQITHKSAYLFRAIITLVIVLTTDILIGSVVIVISVVIYFVLKLIYRKLGENSREIASNRDSLFEGFSEILDSRVISNDLNINEKLQRDYEKRSSSLVNSYSKKTMLNSYKDNWVFVLWNAIVMFATLYLMMLLKSSVLTLTMYLIITPYLTSTIEYFVSFFNVFVDFENANVSVLRLNTIYSMNENELIEFGKNKTDNIEGRVQFYDVTYDSDKRPDGCVVVKNISLVVNEGEIALIQGPRQSGKRTLFYLLRRSIKPSNGMITLGDINIYDYDRKSYVHNLSYVTSKPYFFNESIITNLKYIEPNEKRVIKVCKELEIYDQIMGLSSGFDTNMTSDSSQFSEKLLFMIGLARVILTKSEVVLVYEFPRLGADDQQFVKNKLNELKKHRTIVVFSTNEVVADISDRHYLIEKGGLTLVKDSVKKH